MILVAWGFPVSPTVAFASAVAKICKGKPLLEIYNNVQLTEEMHNIKNV